MADQGPPAERASAAAAVGAATPASTAHGPPTAWSRRDLWRSGGTGALIVVASAAWLLAALWFVGNGAPSTGGDPPAAVLVERTPPPLSDAATPTVASGVGGE